MHDSSMESLATPGPTPIILDRAGEAVVWCLEITEALLSALPCLDFGAARCLATHRSARPDLAMALHRAWRSGSGRLL